MKFSLDTLFMGRKVLFLPECRSTNDIAAEQLQLETQPEGFTVLTEVQTQGKGQLGSRWETKPNQNFTGSFVLKPKNLNSRSAFYLSMIAALAVRDSFIQVIEHSQTDILKGNIAISIKWPNDILINRKKVAGILIENSLSGNYVAHSIIGIGVNLNQQEFEFPQASSIFNETGIKLPLEQYFSILAHNLEGWYLRWQASNLIVAQHYVNNLLFYKSQKKYYPIGSEPISGSIVGISESGELLIESSGQTRVFGIKELNFWQTIIESSTT